MGKRGHQNTGTVSEGISGRIVGRVLVRVLALTCLAGCAGPADPVKAGKANPEARDRAEHERALLPRGVVVRIWGEILREKVPVIRDIDGYVVRERQFKDYESWERGHRTAANAVARAIARNIDGMFYVVDYIPKDRRVLGGTFHVFVDGATFETLHVVSGA
jgi:hypothetical protein